ncbi:MAG: ATP-binding protein, partial [Prevotella sp.]|nr:ATP-binding protein [Prevotella sp.]
KLTTNARILKDVLTHYSSTFNAFKELINNSLQAHARNIYIELRASECDEDSVLYHKIETIKISDDGDGVPLSEFDESIMPQGLVNDTKAFVFRNCNTVSCKNCK